MSPSKHGCFVTATGTDAGKTLISVALIHALRAAGWQVCAVKPIETGCNPLPQDAIALAEACGRPQLATNQEFYRAKAPLAPAAAAILEVHDPPQAAALATACYACVEPGDFLLVEGAGGVLVPINDFETIVDIMAALGLPAIVIAIDTLGTLSHTLCALEALQKRSIPIAAVLLNQPTAPLSPRLADSSASNQALLQARLSVPVLEVTHITSKPSDEQAAATLVDLGLLKLLGA